MRPLNGPHGYGLVTDLVAGGEDGTLWWHVAGHVVLFAALAVHLGPVLSRRLLPRML